MMKLNNNFIKTLNLNNNNYLQTNILFSLHNTTIIKIKKVNSVLKRSRTVSSTQKLFHLDNKKSKSSNKMKANIQI